MKKPKISVVVPVKNEASGIASCLDGILAQTVPVEEVLVIDSGSIDGTQDIVRRYGIARLIEIPPSEFNHGDTRNLGVRECRGDYVLFTVGDARAVDEHWIAHLLKGFTADDVVAVSGIQVVPHSPATNPLEWFRPMSKPEIAVHRFGSAVKYDAASGLEKRAACAIDDVTALYRRDVLETVGFRRVIYGEDLLFAIDALRAGWAIARNPEARVYHYHLDDYATTLKRTVSVELLQYELFGILSQGPRNTPIRNAVRLAREERLMWRERIKWWCYAGEQAKAIRDGLEMVRQAVMEGSASVSRLRDRFSGTPPVPLGKA